MATSSILKEFYAQNEKVFKKLKKEIEKPANDKETVRKSSLKREREKHLSIRAFSEAQSDNKRSGAA